MQRKGKIWSIYRGKKQSIEILPQEVQMLDLLDKDYK